MESPILIDKMLGLTADIAEELLLIKDAGGASLPDGLKLKIISLAELAASSGPESACPPAIDEDVQHGMPDAETIAEAESAEFEEMAEADEPEVSSASGNQEVPEVIEVGGEASDASEAGCVSIPVHENDCETAPEHVPAEPVIAEPSDSQLAADSQRPAHVSAGDLRRAFSINDAFLFRREIFGGSKELFHETLARIATFSTPLQVRDFLKEELRVDPDETPGKEFLEVLLPFFC